MYFLIFSRSNPLVMSIYIILLTGGTVAFAVECPFFTLLILSNLPPA
jgi:hypothetical protein